MLSIAANFIRRPVLTTVCTVIILLLGGIAIPLLPVENMPQIAPTVIQVSAAYTGADATTATDTVTTPLEREINGVEDMRYLSSNTNNSGISSISVTFPTDIDRNQAQVNVQNRVSQAEAGLPDVIRQTGVSVRASSTSALLAYSFFSDRDEGGDPLYDPIFLSNYLDLFVLDELQRLPGVGSVEVLGERKYAMRFWLDPDRMAARGLTANDANNAIRQQNLQVGIGSLGREPMPPGQMFEIPLRANGRFESAEEAENLVLKVGDDGTLVRVKDVGRVELGAEFYNFSAIYNGEPAVALALYQLPGANALETANLIKAKMAELEAAFPPGLETEIAFDTTLFINASTKEVVVALIQAILLVVLIIFLFLQDWRTTLIPAIAIPVALIGAMVGLLVLGFSINQLTLFACVLASGLVVDDGIVVVEAVSAKIAEGMRPLQAALDAMQELSGAVISTSLVLMAVFIPVSFFPGTTGVLYKQFALTIAFAIAFSTFNALTFSPTMSALLLRPQRPVKGPLGALFAGFNRLLAWTTDRYRGVVEALTRVRALVLLLFVGGLAATAFMYQAVPTGFVPEEDQSYFLLIGQAPPGVSLQYSYAQTRAVDEILQQYSDEIDGRLGITGFGLDGAGSNQVTFFVKLRPWDDRPGQGSSAFGLVRRINRDLSQLPGIQIFAANAPPVAGLSSTGGFEFMLQNRSGQPMQTLLDNANQLIAAANQRPEIAAAFTTFTPGVPQLSLSVDRDRANAQNVEVAQIFNTLSTYLGSTYVNDFVLGSRQYRVFVQAEGDFRNRPEDIERLYVRSRDGAMVRLSNVTRVEEIVYPPIISHYNIYPAIKIQGNPAPGYSSGQAIAAMEAVADETLAPGFSYEWTGTALEEITAGGAAPILFGLGFVMVFLVLAAQYESYVDPTIIMLTVPLAILGALSAIWLRGMLTAGSVWPTLSNDIYVQVGLVMLIGMASKNAILIVEFANQSRALGLGIVQSAIQAAEQRFRPIMMTAISTLVGFMPLLVASGAGAISRWSLGTAVFGGMLLATVLSLLFVPILYIAIKSFEERVLQGDDSGSPPPPGQAAEPPAPDPSLPAGDREAVQSLRISPSNEA